MPLKYIGYSDEPNDVRYLRSWLGKRSTELKTLGVGEFMYVNGEHIEKVQAPLFKTSERSKEIEAIA